MKIQTYLIALLALFGIACQTSSPEQQACTDAVRMVEVKNKGLSFLLDAHPVTVAQFRAFVQAKGYRTEAEAFGDAGVFNYYTRQWELAKGATWEWPLGKQGEKAKDSHPVTQVSWNDAKAYCECQGKRLPTEEEWVAAASLDGAGRYAWGNYLVEEGKFMANVWEGAFPNINTGDDGFIYTSPVGSFGTLPSGLMDMGGNVWEWCASDFPVPPGQSMQKVLKGGSFLCDSAVCHGFLIESRTGNTPETALLHQGFRCAK